MSPPRFESPHAHGAVLGCFTATKRAFRRAVLREFARHQWLSEHDARALLEWPHSGLPANRDRSPDWPALRAMRQRWAELLKRIFEVDLLTLPALRR